VGFGGLKSGWRGESMANLPEIVMLESIYGWILSNGQKEVAGRVVRCSR